MAKKQMERHTTVWNRDPWDKNMDSVPDENTVLNRLPPGEIGNQDMSKAGQTADMPYKPITPWGYPSEDESGSAPPKRKRSKSTRVASQPAGDDDSKPLYSDKRGY